MTLFLRNGRQTIVDIELSKQDLHCAIDIRNYSEFLLNNLDHKDEIVESFAEISELRGWFWEVYMEMTNNPSQQDCKEKVKGFLIALADKYSLNYSED